MTHRPLALAFVLAALLAPVSARAGKVDTNAAPLDQYFGKMKMSAIGLRMDVDRLGRRYHARTISDADLVHDAGMAQDAFFAWQKKYPKDPWIAPTAFHLEQLYQAVQSDDARTQALVMLHFLADTYPTSKDAHLARVRLAQGFPPLHEETAIHATPSPYGSGAVADASASPGPSSAANGTAAVSAAASPSAAPASPAAASASPAAAASPTAAPAAN